MGREWTAGLKSFSQIKRYIAGIGKDRLIILLIAGVLLMVLKMPAGKYTQLARSKENKKEQKTENQETGIRTDGTGAVTGAQAQTGQPAELDGDAYVSRMEQRMKQILSQINGVGQTEVILTVEGSGELVVEKDRPYSRDNLNETDAEGGSRMKNAMTDEETTVFWRDTGGNEIPFISKEICPKISGVLVVCQGGGNEQVKKEITDAIVALFDLDVHKIKIAKMRQK